MKLVIDYLLRAARSTDSVPVPKGVLCSIPLF